MELQTQFGLLISKSKEEFIREYKDLNETISREICHQLFTALHKTLQHGNVDNFKKLKHILEYIMVTENPSKFAEYYNNVGNPIKNTNLVLLACKHNKANILKDVLDSDSVILDNVLPNNEDEQLHNAFYYAIRSNSIELLDTLINKWPGNYFAIHLDTLDKFLCSTYEELLLKNVPLSEEIRIFVESQLLNSRFFSKNSEQVQNDKFSLSNIIERIELVVHDINLLRTEYTNKKKIDERFLFIAKFIASNIYILKQQLKSTYNRLPWEEIEFCLVCFISSHIKQQELNLFYQITLNKEKIINHLENFSKKLQDEQFNTTIGVRKFAELPKLNREQVATQIINDCPEFESLYNDHQEIRDIHSLKKIIYYIELATEANPKLKEGKLIITRALQMIGEYVKDTFESPKLSSATNQLLLLSLPKGTRKIIKDLRNSLSHAYSLFERTKIEQNRDIQFFIGVQNDVRKIGNVITDILYNKKITTITTLLKIIVDSENIDEIKEVAKLLNNTDVLDHLSEGAEVLEHQFEKLIEELSNIIPEKTYYEMQLFSKIYNIINFDKNKLALIKSNYLKGFTSLKAINILYERINSDSIRGLKSFANGILKNITPTIEPYRAREIAELAILILKSVELRVEYETLGEINRISSNIFYIAEFGSGNFKWIGEFRGKLNQKSDPISSTVKNAQTKTNIVKEEKYSYNNQLELKLSELKSILDNSVLSEDIIENFPLYKRSKKLQTVVDMLVLDIMSILGILGRKRLGNNNLFVDGSFPLLAGKSLRNHMAHDNAIVEVLLPDPSISVILSAIKLITEDVVTNKSQIGKCAIEDLYELKARHERGLDIISNQERMFLALKEGNLADLAWCLKKGADLTGRSNKLWSSLHFAAKGTSLGVIKFVLDQDLPANLKDIKNQNPLHIAVAYGRESIVKFFVEDLGIHVNDADCYGKTSLHIAAQRGHKQIVEILLKNDANAFVKDVRGYSPLHYAIENNHKDVVDILFKKEINVDFHRTINGSTSLLIAAKNGRLELVNFFLQNEANANAKNHNDGLPIHFAAIHGYVGIVRALISKGADVNIKFTSDGCTPLLYAIEYGHEDIVNILLNHGANLNAVNNVYENSPIHYAAKFGRLKILNTLLKYKASVSVVNSEGKTPLHTAVQSGHLEIVTTLVKHGADIHAKDNRNDRPLHYAAQGGHNEIAEFLIKRGAQINAEGYQNMSPLCEAVIEGHLGVTELLIKYKADVNAKDFQDSTPLHAAALKGEQTITDILIKNKAKVNSKNKGDLTPLHCAALEGNVDVLNILIKNGAKTNSVGNKDFTPLHAAVLKGHLEVVIILIKHKANVNAVSVGSVLHLAAEAGNREIVEVLVDNGANINVLGVNNLTPLCIAIKNNRKNIVEFLIAKGANINAACGGPLLNAVLDGFKDLVELLLENKVDIDVSDAENYTPLHLAAIRGHAEIASLLIKQGSNVNAVTNTGSTLLHVAVKKSHVEFMKILIENGANINAKTIEGTPLHLAVVEHGHREVVEVLLSNGSDINIKHKNDLTPLELAVACNRLECVKTFLEVKRGKVSWRLLNIATENGNLEMIKYLIDGWTNVHVQNVCGQTILHYFVMQGQLEIVGYLISKGTNVNAQDINGITPLHIGATFGFKEIIEVLLKNGASYTTVDKFNRKPIDTSSSEDIISLLSSTEAVIEAVEVGSSIEVENCIKKGAVVNTKAINGETPLHIAAKCGYKRIVDILLKNNANPNAFMDNGYTPLHYAAKFSHYEIVRTLLSNGAIYNAESDNQGTPLDHSVDQDNVVNLLKLINEAFKKVENSNPGLIDDINTIRDIETVRAIMNARNKENKSLLIVAVHNEFPKINQLKEIFQDEVSTEIRTAKALCSQEQYQEALQLLMFAFEKMKDAVGIDNPGTLGIQCEIARVLYMEENYQQSLKLFQDINKKEEEIFGENSNDALNTKIDIALVLNSQRKYQEAFGICEEVYQKQKEMLGMYHPRVLRAQALMGMVLNMSEKYQEALDINYEVFAKVKNILGKADPVTLSAQSHIAMVLKNQGKHGEALKVYQQVYEASRNTLGLVHHDTLRTFHDMVEIFHSQKQYHKLLQAYEELLHDQETVLESDHIDALSTRYIIANLLFDQGNFVGALKYYQESFQQCSIHQIHSVVVNSRIHRDKVLSYEKFDVQEKLCLAARTGDEQFVRYLLQNKLNANDSDVCGISALHYAVGCGPTNLGVINILIANGADITQLTVYGNTPLHTAAFRGYKEIVELLLQHAIRNKLDNYVNVKIPFCDITCLHVAANNGSLDIVKYLLKCGAFYDIENTDGKRPLDLAWDQSVYDLLKLVDELFKNVVNGNVEDIAELKSVKPDEFMAITSARNKKGATLLQVAIISKNKIVASKLIEMLKEVVE